MERRNFQVSHWERKLGLIVPSWNTVNEYEFQRVLAPSVSVHSMRLKITADDEANFTRMAAEVPDASRLLAQAKVEVICYGCLAGGFVKGPSHDEEIAREITAATGTPGVAAATAVIDAFRALKITRVSVASPYEPWLNDKLKNYFMAFGVDVLALKGLGTQQHASFTPEQNAELAAEVDRPDSQAIFISCSNFRTLEIIPLLEKALKKPVLTSNMCSLWKMLRVLGDHRPLLRAGQLFQQA
jgi:maleate isomerase